MAPHGAITTIKSFLILTLSPPMALSRQLYAATIYFNAKEKTSHTLLLSSLSPSVSLLVINDFDKVKIAVLQFHSIGRDRQIVLSLSLFLSLFPHCKVFFEYVYQRLHAFNIVQNDWKIILHLFFLSFLSSHLFDILTATNEVASLDLPLPRSIVKFDFLKRL